MNLTTHEIVAPGEAIWQKVATPNGPFFIIATPDGLVLSSGWVYAPEELLPRIHKSLRPLSLIERRIGLTHREVRSESNSVALDPPTPGEAVEAYYAGDFAAPQRVKVRVAGTPLQQLGWEALREIQPGEPLSYSAFAERLDKPGASRVVASICAKNAAGLFIPCHRVLRSDGSLGGFAWGLDIKSALLGREGAHLFIDG